MSPSPQVLSRSARTSRIARNLAGTVFALVTLYLAVVGFASIPRQIFYPEIDEPHDCDEVAKRVSDDIARVAVGGAPVSFDDKLRTQAQLEGLRMHCPARKEDVKRLMRAHEHAWILEERREAFFKRFRLASLSHGMKAATPEKKEDQ